MGKRFPFIEKIKRFLSIIVTLAQRWPNILCVRKQRRENKSAAVAKTKALISCEVTALCGNFTADQRLCFRSRESTFAYSF